MYILQICTTTADTQIPSTQLLDAWTLRVRVWGLGYGPREMKRATGSTRSSGKLCTSDGAFEGSKYSISIYRPKPIPQFLMIQIPSTDFLETWILIGYAEFLSQKSSDHHAFRGLSGTLNFHVAFVVVVHKQSKISHISRPPADLSNLVRRRKQPWTLVPRTVRVKTKSRVLAQSSIHALQGLRNSHVGKRRWRNRWPCYQVQGSGLATTILRGLYLATRESQ